MQRALVCSTTQIIQIPRAGVSCGLALCLRLGTQPWLHTPKQSKDTSEQGHLKIQAPELKQPGQPLSLHQNSLTPLYSLPWDSPRADHICRLRAGRESTGRHTKRNHRNVTIHSQMLHCSHQFGVEQNITHISTNPGGVKTIVHNYDYHDLGPLGKKFNYIPYILFKEARVRQH